MKEVGRMEQQTLGRETQGRQERTRENPEVWTPERERLSGPAQLAKGVLEGLPLLEMPPARLKDLAALVGNQEMAALLERQSLPLEQTRFTLPRGGETVPCPVPESGQVLTVPPPALPAEEVTGRAFDPAGLVY